MNKFKKIVLIASATFCANLCFATLGQNVQSVNMDASTVNGYVQVIDHGTYQIYEINDPNSDDVYNWSIREYVDPNNDVVFGIAWEGISTNTANIILGGYLQQAEDLAENNEQQNLFKYDLRGTNENYAGYFILLPVTPITVNINVVR